jgi:type I restriction enzyme S subunit
VKVDTVSLRRLVSCLDHGRTPLNAAERAERPGPVPYWGANGVVDHIDTPAFCEPLVLLGEDGAPFLEPGRDVAFAVNGPIWPNNHVHVLRVSPPHDQRFIAYALNTVDYGNVISGSTRDKLTQDDMKLILIPLLSPRDQRATADFLDAETGRIDALLARRAAALDLLSERRTAITIGGVAGGQVPGPRRASTLAWLESIPSYWDEVKLTLVAELGSGHTPSREHPEWWVDCTIPWITTGEVAQLRSDRVEAITETREQISELGLANSAARLRPAGTVVLCRTASAGYSAIMGTDMATSQDFVTWTCGPLLRPRYLLLCLRAMRGDLLGRLAMGSTHKTIYMPDIESIRVPVPPVDEQDAIVDDTWRRLGVIDVATDTIERQIALLQERRQALITAAVTGELEIPVGRAS